MTDTNQEVRETPEVATLYLVRKGALYYRANEQGYTGSILEAGRYTLDQAERITHPNGPDGPRDGMSFLPAPLSTATKATEVQAVSEVDHRRIALLSNIEAFLAMHKDGVLVPPTPGLPIELLEKALAALASAPPPAVPDAVGVRVTPAMVTAFYEKTEVTREGSILGIKEGLAAAIALSSIEPTPSPKPQASNAGGGRMTPAQVAEFVAYDPETGVLSWKPRANRTFTTRYGGKTAFSPTNEGYLAGTINGRAFKAHRVAWAIHFGQWPKGMVDHVNGDRTDNRVANLREVDRRDYNLNIDDFIQEACMPEPMSGCWLWLMQVDRFGYGKVKYKGRTRYAHRAVYEHYHGEQPEDLVIRHRCDTPSCVNPDHLCSGTHQDNMDDMVRRGRSKKCAHRTGGRNV